MQSPRFSYPYYFSESSPHRSSKFRMTTSESPHWPSRSSLHKNPLVDSSALRIDASVPPPHSIPHPFHYLSQLHPERAMGQSLTPNSSTGTTIPTLSAPHAFRHTPVVVSTTLASKSSDLSSTRQGRSSLCSISSLLNPSDSTEPSPLPKHPKRGAIKRLLNEDDKTPQSSVSVGSSPLERSAMMLTPIIPRISPPLTSRPLVDYGWRRHSAEDVPGTKRQRVQMISYPSAPHLGHSIYTTCVLPPVRSLENKTVRTKPSTLDHGLAQKTIVERFVCPYKFPGNNGLCKHDHGSFSRYEFNRSHLTSMHMEYPPKTRKSERETSPGKCMACGVWFRTPDEWINVHLNPGFCPGSLQVPNCLHKKYLFEEAKDTSLTGGVPYIMLSDAHSKNA